jgi:HEAT repeat protein
MIGCALVALCLVALALPAAADIDLPALVRDLGGKDVSKRSAALTQLRNAKDPRVIPLILDAIDGWELFGRYYGVMVLESLPPGKVEGAFRSLLQKDDPYVRLCAATWFLRQGDERHVDVIVESLEKAGVELSERLYMVNRLYSLTDERIRRALFGLLDAEAPVTLLGAVLQALQYPEHEPSKEAVRAFLVGAEKPEARLLAAAFLYRFGDETKKEDIAEALASGEITSTAFYRLKTFLSQAGHVATEILDAAAALLATEENAYTCKAAVELLAEFGHRKALPAIQKLADHEDANLAKAVFEAVVVLGGGIEKATLVSLLAHESLDRRVAAAELLRRMDDNSGLAALVGVLGEGSEQERWTAAQALQRFRVRGAIDPLIDALLDESPRVRQSALYGLDQVVRSLFPYRRLDFVAAGYTAAAPEDERRSAVVKIRAWWEAHRDGNW